jgi:hypothetical protein
VFETDLGGGFGGARKGAQGGYKNKQQSVNVWETRRGTCIAAYHRHTPNENTAIHGEDVTRIIQQQKGVIYNYNIEELHRELESEHSGDAGFTYQCTGHQSVVLPASPVRACLHRLDR